MLVVDDAKNFERAYRQAAEKDNQGQSVNEAHGSLLSIDITRFRVDAG